MKFLTFCSIITVLLACINANAGLQEKLVIHFSFDNIDGKTVINEVDNNINGTLEGNAEQVPGYLDMGIGLNDDVDEGTPGDEFVRIESSEVNVGDEITIASWLKATNYGTYRTVMSNTDGAGYALTVEDGMPTAWVHVGGDYLHVTGKTVLATDEWFHLALTFDGSDAIIYLDGKEDGKGTKEGDITISASDFFIGAEPSGQNIDNSYPAWHGTLDEFYFYNRALTGDEINLLIKQASSVYSKDKLAVNWATLKNCVDIMSTLNEKAR